MRKLTKEVHRQISSIFDVLLSNESDSFDLSIHLTHSRVKTELIAYCERQSDTIITINRFDQENNWLSGLSFKTPYTDNIKHSKNLHIELTKQLDSFIVTEVFERGPKQKVYTFKLK